ncbi:MAG: calcineurin-like phosphoesterase C-terminal domain-containing protein [Sphingobacteriaceae bacterium]
MKKIFLILPAILFCYHLQAQTISKGFVFQDNDKNGKKDRTEKGIPGISVSNGVNVVKTDQSGQYQLHVGDDNIIFVIKPSGYQVPLNEQNQPQYYYIHKPFGSPANFRYKGSAATGNLPKSVDFALTPQDEPKTFTSLIFGDPQAYTMEEINYFTNGVVSEVEGIKNIGFGLSLGDLVGDNLSLHNPYIKAAGKIGVPWYNLIGNHDMNYDATTDSLSDETFEANFGPANYAFNYGNAHFIILDDILYPDPRDDKGYWGGFRKDQLDFVENDLKLVDKNKLIVLAFHIPLQSEKENGSFRMDDRQRLFNILKDFPHTLSISAHTHIQRHNFYGKAEGWRQEKPHHEYNAGTTSGDWYSGELNEQGVPASTMRDGTPKGYAFLTIKDNEYTILYKVAGKPKEYQIEIFNPKVVAKGRNTGAGIFANFFMGKKGDKVTYRIDKGDWNEMIYQEEPDPSFLKDLFKWDTTDELMPGRRPSNAINSTHLWRATIPTKLPVGKHLIDVSAKDMFGNIFTRESFFNVEDPVKQ